MCAVCSAVTTVGIRQRVRVPPRSNYELTHPPPPSFSTPCAAIKAQEDAGPFVAPFESVFPRAINAKMDDNLAVFCMYAGQLTLLAKRVDLAEPFLTMARDHLVTVSHMDASVPLKTCVDLLALIHSSPPDKYAGGVAVKKKGKKGKKGRRGGGADRTGGGGGNGSGGGGSGTSHGGTGGVRGSGSNRGLSADP